MTHGRLLMYVYRDDGTMLNGWHGYNSNGLFLTWYFINNVPMGYVEGLWINGTQEPQSYGYSFQNRFHGSLATEAEAKSLLEKELRKWWVDSEDLIAPIPCG